MMSASGKNFKTYRLSVDLGSLRAVGEVDRERVAGRQLAAVNGRGAIARGDVGREQDGRRRIADHVGQVDVEGVLVGAH